MTDAQPSAFDQWRDLDTSCDMTPEPTDAQRRAWVAQLDHLEGHEVPSLSLSLPSKED
jgi:hypothetical protein